MTGKVLSVKWDDTLAELAVRTWYRVLSLDAAMITCAKWTPVVMVGVIVFASLGFGLPSPLHAIALRQAIVAVSAALFARALNEPISHWVNRARPFEVMGCLPLTEHETGFGFPSNHTTGAFALAVSMLPVPGYSPILFILAVLLGTARLYTGLHYLTDVLAGVLHGTLVAAVMGWIAGLIHP